MATNVFYCPKCGKYTTHIEISMREINALEGGNFLTQSISTIMDMITIDLCKYARKNSG